MFLTFFAMKCNGFARDTKGCFITEYSMVIDCGLGGFDYLF